MGTNVGLKHARREPGGIRRVAATDETRSTVADYIATVPQSQVSNSPQVLFSAFDGRKRNLAAIVADMDLAFRLGKYELAAIYLKEWRRRKALHQDGDQCL